jgi:CBS domain-containing protein
MIVGKRMSSPIITVPPSMPLNDAVTLMKKEKNPPHGRRG